METRYKVVRLMGQASRSARIFHEWLESQDIIALPNEKEVVMTHRGPVPMRNCAVFTSEMAERVADAFNEWIRSRDTVEVVNVVRTPDEWSKGLPGSKKKVVKMYVGGAHKPSAFAQNWYPE